MEYTHAQLLAHVLTCEIHNPVPWHDSSMSFVSWSEPSALTHELLAFMRKVCVCVCLCVSVCVCVSVVCVFAVARKDVESRFLV